MAWVCGFWLMMGDGAQLVVVWGGAGIEHVRMTLGANTRGLAPRTGPESEAPRSARVGSGRGAQGHEGSCSGPACVRRFGGAAGGHRRTQTCAIDPGNVSLIVLNDVLDRLGKRDARCCAQGTQSIPATAQLVPQSLRRRVPLCTCEGGETAGLE